MENRDGFQQSIIKELQKGNKHNKRSIEKIAEQFNISNRTTIKELTELSIVSVARQICNKDISNEDKYSEIVELYYSQVNLSHRTTQSILFQQYSTPAPISFLASTYVLKNGLKSLYFEPSAGNGLLTIALPYPQTIVNELDELRNRNLNTQPYKLVTRVDAENPFVDYYKKFDGVTTNPPFGSLENTVKYDGFPIKTLDHLMALRALDTMKDNGKAAIIIGGHTKWDSKGRTQAGRNRIFLNYLYSHYNVDDIISINGKKLYSRQGTGFDTRLILVDGRKQTIEGVAPLKNNIISEVVSDFDRLYQRVLGIKQVDSKDEEKVKRLRIFKFKAAAKLKLLELQDLEKQKKTTSLVSLDPQILDLVIAPKNTKISKIHTDTKRFQNRSNAFSSESKDRIIRAVESGEFSWAKFDPIMIWKDKNGKYYVIFGHSRLAAFKQMNKENYLLQIKNTTFDFSTIPTREFIGTEIEAIDTALNSNTLSTRETEVERAMYYSKQRIMCQAKKEGKVSCRSLVEKKIKENEGKNANYISNLSYLNADGYLIDMLTSLGVEKDNDNTNVLRIIANWIGEARKNNNEITDLQETEIAKFLLNGGYGDKSNQFKNKVKFNERLKYSFDKWKAAGSNNNVTLNLANTLSKSSFEKEYDTRLNEAKKLYDEALKEHEEKHEKYLIAVMENRITEKEMNNLMKAIFNNVVRTREELKRIRGQKGDVDNASSQQTSLFGIKNKRKY